MVTQKFPYLCMSIEPVKIIPKDAKVNPLDR